MCRAALVEVCAGGVLELLHRCGIELPRHDLAFHEWLHFLRIADGLLFRMRIALQSVIIVDDRRHLLGRINLG